MPNMMSAMVARPVAGFWRYYCVQLDRKPLLTRVLTGVAGGVLGDAVAQHSERAIRRQRSAPVVYGCVPVESDKLEEYEEMYDWERTFRLALWSGVIAAPMGYKWFQLLDGAVMPHNPTSIQAIILKTLLDQLIMAPLGTALFLMGMKALEGKPSESVQSLRDKFLPVIRGSYLLWPMAHVINFKFVPPSQRILYVNAVSVGWNAILSFLYQAEEGEQEGVLLGHAKLA